MGWYIQWGVLPVSTVGWKVYKQYYEYEDENALGGLKHAQVCICNSTSAPTTRSLFLTLRNILLSFIWVQLLTTKRMDSIKVVFYALSIHEWPISICFWFVGYFNNFIQTSVQQMLANCLFAFLCLLPVDPFNSVSLSLVVVSSIRCRHIPLAAPLCHTHKRCMMCSYERCIKRLYHFIISFFPNKTHRLHNNIHSNRALIRSLTIFDFQ